MATNYNGRVAYVDAPDAGSQLFNRLVDIDKIILLGGSAATTLTLYEGTAATAGKEIFIGEAAIDVNQVFDIAVGGRAIPREWFKIWMVLAGAGSKALIYYS